MKGNKTVYTGLLTVLAFLFLNTSDAQDFRELKSQDSASFKAKEMPTIELNQGEKEKEDNLKNRREEAKTKTRKRWYYGRKTKKGFTESGYGRRKTIELFRYLKNYEEPDWFVDKIYWYDTKHDKIQTSTEIKEEEKEYAKILHGQYKKLRNDEIIEKGWFFLGTKQGRWVKYSLPKQKTFKDTVKITEKKLKDKTVYHMGWPVTYEISYYGNQRKKVKEVLPYENGELNGNYYYFFKNGEIAIEGEYKAGMKAGTWNVYHKGGNYHMRDMEIKYPHNPLKESFRPYIKQQWDKKGGVLYREKRSDTTKKYLKKPLEEPPLGKNEKKYFSSQALKKAKKHPGNE